MNKPCLLKKKTEMIESVSPDYRNSHLAPEKGKSYHATFSDNPYRNMIWGFEKKILDQMPATFLKNREIRHLDFACGTGRILAYFENLAKVSVGVDISHNMLEVARENRCCSELIEADLTRNDILENRKFNLITAFRFFPNAQPELREEALRVILKHLDIDGWFVFNNHKNLGSFKYRLARLRRRGGFKGMSLSEVNDLLLKNGLKIEKKYSLAFLPANERWNLLPIYIIRRLEGLFSKCSILGEYGENLVFICRRAENVGLEKY